MPVKPPDRPTLLLLAGALSGALLAATGVLERDIDTLPPGVIATVNGSPIHTRQWLAYLDALQQDRRNPMADAERARVLDRMIEERLLIQRGLDVGLAESESTVRKAIVDAMIEGLLAEVAASTPREAELTAFFADNQGYFAGPDLLWVERMVFAGAAARQRAEQALSLLGDRSFVEVKQAFADPEVLSLPGTPVPTTRLQNYLGPAQSQVAAGLDTGEHSDLLADGERWVILYCHERQDAAPAEFTQVREQVLQEYQRRQGDERLRRFLDDLRADADIRTDKTQLETR